MRQRKNDRRPGNACWALWLAASLGCGAPADIPTSVHFSDVTRPSGIDFRHTNGASGDYNYPETFGAGVAWLDVDGDGWLDLYFVNGGQLIDRDKNPPPAHPSSANSSTANPSSGSSSSGHLYRNLLGENGAGFQDITERSNAVSHGYGMGVAAADVDANGEVDLYITNVGPNELLLQRNRQFQRQPLAADDGWGTGCAFTDLDQDGDLDLVAVNYVQFDPNQPHACQRGSIQTYCDPDVYEPQSDVLYQNLLTETGQFDLREMSRASGFSIPGRSLGLAVADLDLDGDSELFVANDGQPNLLYRNDSTYGRIRLSEVGLASGVRFNADGMAEAGMGVDVGDVDADGWPDLIVANFSRETHTLYRQTQPTLHFRDATRLAGLARATFLPLGFGINLFDADLDGDLDLFSAHGHVLDKAEQIDPSLTYAQPDGFYLNESGRFLDRSALLGTAHTEPRPSRASAAADFDRDGDLDIVVTTVGGAPRLLRNERISESHWITISLRTNQTGNVSGWGSRIDVLSDGQMRSRQLQSGGSYLSSPPAEVHFGLGDAESVNVTIHWHGAETESWPDLAIDRMHQLVEGQTLLP